MGFLRWILLGALVVVGPAVQAQTAAPASAAASAASAAKAGSAPAAPAAVASPASTATAQAAAVVAAPSAAASATAAAGLLKVVPAVAPADTQVAGWPRVQLGEVLRIRASGALVAQLKAAKPENVKLVLDDLTIPGLKVSFQQGPGADELDVVIPVLRDANAEANRKAWDAALAKHNSPTMEMPVALAIGDAPALRVAPGYVNFYVASGGWITSVVAAGFALFAFAFWRLQRHPTLLRDARNGPYSLARSQMAFWGLVVALSFLGVWLVTGSMERIPQQVLVLMGISAATGLSAVLISSGKAAERVTQLQAEIAQLEMDTAADPTKADPPRMKKLKDALQAAQQPAQNAPASTTWAHFFRDICSDDNGATFHRVQVVMWTGILGLVFLRSVSQVMSMPDFPDTLLLLMGISNGTYLGFKFPEKSTT